MTSRILTPHTGSEPAPALMPVSGPSQRTLRQRLLNGTSFGTCAALAAVMGLSVAAQPAHAACTPATGGTGANQFITVTCDGTTADVDGEDLSTSRRLITVDIQDIASITNSTDSTNPAFSITANRTLSSDVTFSTATNTLISAGPGGADAVSVDINSLTSDSTFNINGLIVATSGDAIDFEAENGSVAYNITGGVVRGSEDGIDIVSDTTSGVSPVRALGVTINIDEYGRIEGTGENAVEVEVSANTNVIFTSIPSGIAVADITVDNAGLLASSLSGVGGGAVG